MTTSPHLPGTMYLVDTSAMARLDIKSVHDIIAGVIDAGMAATCITVELEAGFSGRTAGEIEQIFSARDQHFQYLPVNDLVTAQARRTMQLLAARGLHRAAGAMDILTAAVAEVHRAIVLHYDADFDHIASVTGQRTEWVAPRGSV